VTQVALAVLGLFCLLVAGLPIAFGMSITGVLGFAGFASLDAGLAMLGQTTFDTVMNYGFSVLPMFILMGNVIARSRIADDLYEAAGAFVGHRRGGLAGATVIACAGFGSICGSSVATAATMARISVPAMLSRGYSPRLALGTVAASGTLGIMIPPSVAMVIYGMITETDIAELFVAGVLPGLLGAACYMGAIWVHCRLNRSDGAPAPRVAWPVRLAMLGRLSAVLLLLTLVMGGIYAGVFTVTEAAAIGALLACLIAAARRDLDLRGFVEVFAATGRTTAMLFLVVIGALALTAFLNVAGLPPLVTGFLDRLDAPPIVVLLAVLAIFVLLGTALDDMAIMLLMVPITFPVVIGLGYDPVWFGILVITVTELGLISPPFGMNLFVTREVLRREPISTIFHGVVPFMGGTLVRLALLVAFPGIALVLTGRPW
jgi:tripartite ATP-independent transporter DctM subunit